MSKNILNIPTNRVPMLQVVTPKTIYNGHTVEATADQSDNALLANNKKGRVSI